MVIHSQGIVKLFPLPQITANHANRGLHYQPHCVKIELLLKSMPDAYNLHVPCAIKDTDVRKNDKGESTKRMTDENENLLDAKSGVLEYAKLEKHIHKMELFRLLLKLQPDPDNLNEEGVQNTEENTYPFSIVLRWATEQGFEEQDFISQMFDFHKSGYVELSNDGEIESEEQLRSETNSKIRICLNEEKMLRVLVDDSVSLSKTMKNLATLLKKQADNWNTYNSNREEMDRQYREMEKWHDDSDSIMKKWEKDRKDDQEKRDRQAKELKADVIDIAKKETDSRLEDELKLSGKIGIEMQNMQKDIIQFMGIFIAIFALLGLNISNAGTWSTADFFHINLIITASMATLLLLVSIIMNGKSHRTSCMGILTAALWAVSAFIFFAFPYFKDELISFWETYYK